MILGVVLVVRLGVLLDEDVILVFVLVFGVVLEMVEVLVVVFLVFCE